MGRDKNPFASVTLQKETGGRLRRRRRERTRRRALVWGVALVASHQRQGLVVSVDLLLLRVQEWIWSLAAAAGAGLVGLRRQHQLVVGIWKSSSWDEKGGADATTQSTAAVPYLGR
eukprot:jgi/Picre1/34664/NNA_002132.t1